MTVRDHYADFVRLEELCARITLPPEMWLEVRSPADFLNTYQFQIQSHMLAADVYTGKPIAVTSTVSVHPDFTEGEVIHKVRKMCIEKLEHEFLEYFAVDGVLVADPHAN